MRSSEVEAVLREHPGVRDAVAIFHGLDPSQQKLVGYVVADAAYLEKLITGTEEEPKRLQKWRKTFDLMQFGKDAAASPVAFNIAGWNSSYTRQPIPAEEMREWVAETVKSIEALKPREVLEIGCGAGLLVLRIAPSCSRYVATDFSGAVLQRLKEQFAQGGGNWDAVTLLERTADNFEGLDADSFDTVIINSVVQYFPSVAYLTRVLEQALHVLKPGGKIFVGDVLSLPLLEAYSASVELFQGSPTKTLAELREQVHRRILQQPHLLLSPAFFLALKKRYPAISGVEIRPKRGSFDNELTRFRFDATICLGEGSADRLVPEWQDWVSTGFTLPRLRKALQDAQCAQLAFKDVPNARLFHDVAAAKEISRGDCSRSAADLKSALDSTELPAIHPHELFNLANELGFDLDWSWASSRNDGSFDLLFRRRASDQTTSPRVSWPQPDSIGMNLTQYANTPGQPALHNKLTQDLSAYSKGKLPPSMVPAVFVLIETIPLKPDGQPDFEALPIPDLSVV